MILLALFLIALGTLLGQWMKVSVLIPATLFAWGAAVQVGSADAFSAVQTLLAIFLCGACLQLGYLAGAVLLHQHLAQIRKRAVVSTRR
jgi:hypothetical protein